MILPIPLYVIWYGHSLNRLCLGDCTHDSQLDRLRNVVAQIAIRYLYFPFSRNLTFVALWYRADLP